MSLELDLIEFEFLYSLLLKFENLNSEYRSFSSEETALLNSLISKCDKEFSK